MPWWMGVAGRDETDVVDGLLGAADSFDGRLPELFSGHSPEEHDLPVPYPASRSPQAWAAAAPLTLLRPMTAPARCPTSGPDWFGSVPVRGSEARIRGAGGAPTRTVRA
jgi:glycogen debranching enzyme